MNDQKNDDISEVCTRIETREIVLSTLAGKKNLERLSRVPECTDRAETSTNVSGRASCVQILAASAKSARAKRKIGKSTKI